MRKPLLSLVLFAALGGALSLPVFADSNTVNVSVTPMVVAVNVNPTSIDYGTLALSTADDSRSKAVSGQIAVTNTGSVAADYKIRGSNATPSVGTEATWTLNCTGTTGVVDVNQYVHRFTTMGASDFDIGGGNTLCPTDKTLATNQNTNGELDVTFQMNMPTGSTGYSSRSSTITVVASAH